MSLEYSAVMERAGAAHDDMHQAQAERAEVENRGALATLLHEIKTLVNTYITLPGAGLAMLLAVWIVGTYVFHHFHYFGYLSVRSPTPRCGKSRLLKLIAMLVLGSPPITTTPTAAVLFRSTRKVLILDEVDRLRNNDKETFGQVMAILNFGFERDGIVERCEKVKGVFVVNAYPVYGPKALAGIERLADTLADRAFTIPMERTSTRMPRLNVRRLRNTTQDLQARIQVWVDEHTSAIEELYDKLPDQVDKLAEFDDRFQDIAESLLVIASLADGEQSGSVAVSLELLTGLKSAAGRKEVSGREQMLVVFLDVVTEALKNQSSVFIASNDLLSKCGEREELAGIQTARGLAGFLKHFDLRPRPDSTRKFRGYDITREWATEWGARYGPRTKGSQ